MPQLAEHNVLTAHLVSKLADLHAAIRDVHVEMIRADSEVTDLPAEIFDRLFLVADLLAEVCDGNVGLADPIYEVGDL